MRDEYLVDKINYRGYAIRIEQDSDPMSPDDWDNLCSRACWHRDYTLSSNDVETRTDNRDKKVDYYFGEPEEFQQFCKDNKVLVMNLRLYDHSGITISVSNEYPYNDRWDSGQVGWIFVTYENIRKEYGVKKVTKKVLEKARNTMLAEVETFDNYLTGSVYGFRVVKENEEDADFDPMDNLDSCWGFYGREGIKDAVAEAKSSIDFEIKKQRKEHAEKIKMWIRSKVPLEYREPMNELFYNY
jgi:hypothetical protein